MHDQEPAPTRAPGSFKGLLSRLGIALALFVVVNVAAGYGLDACRRRCKAGDSGVINNAILAAPDILILGSSRAKHHYDDEYLSRQWGRRVFNTGQGGQGLPFSRIVLEQVVATKKPAAIIIDVMLFDEAMNRVHALDPWYPDSAILRDMPGQEDTPGKNNPDKWKTRVLMHIPAYRYAGEVWGTIKDSRKPVRPFGFVPINSDQPMFVEPLATEPKQSRWLIPQLDALVDEAKKTGAEVVLCFSPMKSRNCERAIVEPVRAYAKIKGVPFLTFDENTHPALADVSLYKDTWHMNAKGARAFSEVLVRELPAYLPSTLGRGTNR